MRAAELCRQAGSAVAEIAAMARGGGWAGASGPVRFRTGRPGRAEIDVEASTAEGWLLLKGFPAGGPAVRAALPRWSLLAANPLLPGGAKFAAGGDGASLRLRAEIPLAGAGDPAGAVASALVGLRRGARWWIAGSTPLPSGPRGRRLRIAGGEETAAAAEASGWPFEARRGGRLCFSLECEPAQVAEVAADGSGWRATAAIARRDGIPPEACREAVGQLLLAAGDGLRLVRVGVRGPVAGGPPAVVPGGEAGGGGTSVFLEVPLPPAPDPADLARALEALSVGCRACAREVHVLLEHEDCSRAFLAVRGPRR